jgi:hypothetical protein
MVSNKEVPNTATEQGGPITPAAIVEQVRAMRASIPDFQQLPTPKSRKLRNVARIHPDFVQSAINTVGVFTGVETVLGRTHGELTQEVIDVAAWSAAEEEIRALLEGVMAANLVRRHRLGLVALQTYAISRRMAADGTQSGLLSHVQEMKRLNRLGKARTKASPKPQPQPSPQQQA